MPIPFEPPNLPLAYQESNLDKFNKSLEILNAYAEQRRNRNFQQQQLMSLDAQRKAKEFEAIAPYIPEAQIPSAAKQYGINVQTEGSVPPIQSTGTVAGEIPQDSTSPFINHWNTTIGQEQMTPTRPTSKAGLEKYQKNLQMTKIEGEMAPKIPITKEALIASGESFDPMKQVIVEPPNKLEISNKENQQQDKLEGQAIQRVTNLRGDASMARTENQRDAAIQAYNTIKRVKEEGRLPSQIEYYDLLGQMWKARTGSSPTDQAIRDLDAKTLKGSLAKAYQYFSGKPAGITTSEILDNVQAFASDSGMQADKLHSGYMKSHLIKPTGLNNDRWQNILSTHRGLDFQEATGYKAKTPSTQTIYNDPAKEARYQEWKAKQASQ